MVVKGSNQTFYTTNSSSSKKHSHNNNEYLFDPPTISLTPASKAKLAQQLSSFQDTIEKKERLSHLQHSFFRKYKQQQLQNTTTTPTKRHYKRTMDSSQSEQQQQQVPSPEQQPPVSVVSSEAPSSAEGVDEATTQLQEQERQPQIATEQDGEASTQQVSATAEAERPHHDNSAQRAQAEQPQEVIDLTSVVEEDLGHQRAPPPAPERVPERPPVAPAAAAEEESQQQHKEFSKRLLVLVSNSQFNRKSSADSSRAMTMLALKNLPYEIVDGMDPAQKERRNELFDLSGRRGVYPQFFLVSSVTEETTVVGDMETIDGINDCSAMPAELLEANPGIVTWERLLR